MPHSTFHNPHSKAGYTLIELMVAIAIFSTVVGLTASTFVISLKGQRKSFTSQNVSDSVRYVMDIMTKEIRMAKDFCPPADPCNANKIVFTSNMPNRYGEKLVFYLNGERIEFDDGSGSFTAITPSNVKVTDLKFDIIGNATGDQPRITIVIRAESKGTKDDVKSNIDLQTTISPRNIF